MKKVFVIYSEILMSFFDLRFFDVLRIVQENEWHIWNPEEILDKKHVLFMQKYWFENLTWPWPDLELTSIKSQIGWCHRVKWLSPSRSACKMTQKTCVARHVCDLFYSDLLWPDLDLDLFTYAIHTHAVSFVDIYPALWVSVFAARLTDPGPQNAKTSHFDLWPDLDLTH